jgi:hypothetical protein
VQYLPDPTHLIYLVLLGVFGVQAAGVLAMRETASREYGSAVILLAVLALVGLLLRRPARTVPVPAGCGSPR